MQNKYKEAQNYLQAQYDPKASQNNYTDSKRQQGDTT